MNIANDPSVIWSVFFVGGGVLARMRSRIMPRVRSETVHFCFLVQRTASSRAQGH
jgi:hypothetical protein